uniref:Uncharacterized protein n=1 Tax=Rhizophora mucronata TaxID=61149 RepID=A0A2P2P616_RHIMU
MSISSYCFAYICFD